MGSVDPDLMKCIKRRVYSSGKELCCLERFVSENIGIETNIWTGKGMIDKSLHDIHD